MPDVFLAWLKAPAIAQEPLPGQFVMVKCGEDTLLPRPLVVHRKEGDSIAVLFRTSGAGTKWLSERKAGDEIPIFGPLGNGYTVSPDSENLLLVTGGIGIASIYSLASSLDTEKYSIKMILGASTVDQLYPREYLSLSSKIDIVNVTEDGTSGKEGMVTDYIGNYAGWADQIFACGPLGMYKTMAQMSGLQSKLVQISLEVRMACGRGICYGCTIKTKQGLRRVCEHGPTFSLRDILLDELTL